MEESRIVLYYVGVHINTNFDKKSYVYIDENNKKLSFSKKIIECPIGMPITVTRTDGGVKGPYIINWDKHKHELSATWFAEDMANRKLLELKRMKSKEPNLIKSFENILFQITCDMTKTQKQAFLMKYILNVK